MVELQLLNVSSKKCGVLFYGTQDCTYKDICALKAVQAKFLRFLKVPHFVANVLLMLNFISFEFSCNSAGQNIGLNKF